ncbi:MAG: universal stress protein [Leptolyngbya sp. Prado105]|jgi:hypothetical protein|nr:universal stress protein [Leptolyngbya sp. Prado105]
MFQRILVILEDIQSRHCVFNTALRFAKANQARLCVVDLLADHSLENDLRSLAESTIPFGTPIERLELVEKTDGAILKTAEHWNADLIVLGHAVPLSLCQTLPCTVLIVQQKIHFNEISEATQTISITMQLKPQSPDLAVRNRLERLLELTPSS